MQKRLFLLLVTLFMTVAGSQAQTTLSLPYIHDFEDDATGSSAALPQGWTRINDATGSYNYYPYINTGTSSAHSGTKYLYFYLSTTASYASNEYMVLPPVAATHSMANVRMSFWAKRSTNDARLYIGVINDDAQAASFQVIDSIDLSQTYQHYTISFADYTGTNRRIAWKMSRSSSLTYAYIDDLYIVEQGSCPDPTNLTIQPVDETTVLASWTDSSTTSVWRIFYGTPTIADTLDSIDVTTNPATISGLNPGTVYQCYVMSQCPDLSYSNPSWYTNFKTPCYSIPTDSLPYTYGFEDATTSGTNGEITPCWNRHEFTPSSHYPYPSTTQHHSGSYALYFYNSANSANFSWATLPRFENNLSELQLSFWAYKTSANYGHLTIGVMTDPDDINTFDTLTSIQVSSASDWEYFEVPLYSYTGTGRYLAFLSTASTASYTYLDDITVDLAPSCPRPDNIAAENPTAHSFDLTWHSEAAAYEYQIEYGRQGFTPGTGILLTAYDTTTFIENLDMGVGYDFYIRAICGSDTSTWNSATLFTNCDTITLAELPYFEDFESYGTGSSNPISPCWTKYSSSTTAYPYPYSTAAINGNRGLYFYGYRSSSSNTYSYAVLPPVASDLPVSSLMLQFMAKRYSTTSTSYHSMIIVGIADGLDSIDSFTPVDTVDLTPQAASSIHNIEVPFSSYTGTGRYVVLYCPAPATNSHYNHIYLDDITLMRIPTCFRPADVVVTALAPDSISLAWTPDSRTAQPASGFSVEYYPTNYGEDYVTVTTTTDTFLTLTSLDPATSYTISVRSDCGDELSDPRTFTISTTCPYIPDDSLPYLEDFDSYPATTAAAGGQTINPCWTKGTNYSTAYPYVYTTQHSSEPNSMYFYATASYYSYLALPAFETDINHLELSFDLYKTSVNYGRMRIGAMSNPNDISTFTTLAYVQPSAVSTWERFQLTFPDYEGSARYLAFLLPDSATSYAQLDNISVARRSSCPTPQNITAALITADNATITWSADSLATDWTIYYGQPGFATDTALFITTTDTFATLTGLLPNTQYECIVFASCSGDLSNPTFPLAFRTACLPIPASGLPYTENFDSYPATTSIADGQGLDPCWTKGTNSSSAYPYLYSSNSVSAPNSLRFYSTSIYYSYAALPLFETDIHSLMVNFDIVRHSTSYTSKLAVGVMTNPYDITTFTPIATCYPGNLSAGDSASFEVMFDSYHGTSGYIAFLAPNDSTNYSHLDNVRVSLIPDCRRSSNLLASNVTHNSADLTWHNSSLSPSSFVIAYGTSPNFNPATATQTVTVYDTAATLTGLADYTTYYWAVRALCSADSGAWSSVASFSTLLDCGPNSINIIDTIGQGTSSTTTYTMYPSTSYPTAYSRNIFTVEELADMGIYTNNTINSISLHCGSTGGTVNDVRIYAAETDLEAFSSTPANDTLNRANMTLLYSGNIVCSAGQWVEIPFDTAFHYSGTRNLMLLLARQSTSSAGVTFYYSSTSPDYRSCYGYRTSASTANNTATRTYNRTNMIFNICSEIPSCEWPTNITLTSLTNTSAAFAWQGTGVRYETAIGPSGFNPDTIASLAGLHQFTDSTHINLTALNSNTEYDFYIRSYCSSGDTSDWSIPLTFRTPCNPAPLPFTENFESYNSGSSNPLNSCWRKGTNSTTAYPYPYSTNAINGNISLYFYAYRSSTTNYYSYAALPLMAARADSLQITFNMRRYSSTSNNYTSRIVVGLMTDPSDIATFTPVDTIDMHDDEPLSIRGIEVPFAGFPNSGQYIALYNETPELYAGSTTTYSYVYIDDITVDYIPSCPSPLNVTVADTNVTTTTALVSWTNRAASVGYEIEYGPEGFTPGSGTSTTSTTTSATLTGLTPGTHYDVYVRAICGGADTGNWSFPTNFTTHCVPIDVLPVTFDFENLQTGTTAPLPVCWNHINNGTTNGYYPYPYSSTTYAHSGTNVLYWYMSTTTGTYGDYALAVLPEVDTLVYPANTLEISFWGRGSTSSDNSIILGMMTDPTDQSSFVPVQTITMDATVRFYQVSFAGYTGHGSYPAFRKNRGTTSGYAYIDDVTIAQLSPCPRPYNLQSISSTATTATLTWSDTIGSTQWQVVYQPVGSTTVYYENVLSDTATLTGLTPSTVYTFRVKAYCPASSSLSDVSLEEGLFSTAQIPDTVPVLYDFEDAAQWTAWQTTSNTSVGWYRGTAPYTDGHHGIYISADGGSTIGTDMQSIVNACAYRDIDFGPDPRSCNVTFRINVGGSQAGNYDGVALILADPSVLVQSSDTRLTTPWGHVNDVFLNLTRRTSGWQTVTVPLDNVSGVQRLVFYWFNQSTGAADFVGQAPAIDSIHVYDQPCARPYDLSVTSVTENSADITWAGPASGTTYIVAYRQADAAATTNRYDTVLTNHTTLYGLNSNTEYHFWVRRICDADHRSDYSNGLLFQTVCGYMSAYDTIREGFEGFTAVAYNSEGTLPPCWQGYTNGTNAVYTPHVVGSGTYWYTLEGSGSVVLTSGSGAAYGNTKIIRLPMTAEPINTLTLSYWMCTEGSSQGTLSVGYMTGDNYETDFVSVRDIAASSATQHSGSGLQTGRGIFDTVTFDSVPATARYLAFKWYHNSTFYSCCLDNIQVTSSVSCPAPAIVSVAHNYESINLAWASAADTFDVAITPGSWNASVTPLATTTAHSYAFTGLTPSTLYTVGVRQHCPGGTASIWATAVVTTDSLGCITPTGFAVSAITHNNAQFDWSPLGSETNWNVHIWNSSNLDSIYLASTHPVTLGGLMPGVTYSASLQPLCGNSLIPSDWGDTITFTTATCPDVTGLSVSEVTASSVTLSWTADPAALNWIIEYGYIGFNQGTGTTANSSNPSITLNGLECETDYEFYVRAVCGTDWNSESWAHVQATTQECSHPCEAPYGIVTTVTGNSVAVSWTPATGNTSYEVEYGTAGFVHGTGTLISAAEPNTTINGLNYNTDYDLYVRAICGSDNYSSWSPVSTFTTQPLGIGSAATASCAIHPNPTSGSTTISVSGVDGRVKIEVVDMNGRAVASETLQCSADCSKTIDVDHLAQGAYFVRITATDLNIVRKLIVR